MQIKKKNIAFEKEKKFNKLVYFFYIYEWMVYEAFYTHICRRKKTQTYNELV